MPEGARIRSDHVRRLSAEVQNAARQLKQQSRFLCRRSDRLRAHSNDLLTVALFRRQKHQRALEAPPRHLVLLP
ncbi:MAG TPA: hypothetical protein VJQ44_06045 [Gemmatimonadales bacterium]|nr:hypothetical protein [Gemmatimonadales bacterium]